ncbi:MAG TPA: vWA domain-containing protein, partial [Candidatus Hydrogenedentes bacterium]|nr:vWA domain-containing protein [Candidatus Hydrogenedentota bacterium]
APDASSGLLDKKIISVAVDRTQLRAGQHEGKVTFTSRGIVAKTVTIRVTQDVDGTPRGRINFLDKPVAVYGTPYLLDFNFALVNERGDPIVAEPAQFQLSAREDARDVDQELTGAHLQRTAARQAKVLLVLDYSLSMQRAPDAIVAMEHAARNTLLPALGAGALVGVYEFHRDDRAPQAVIGLTTDKDLVSNAIGAIQSQFVQDFSSGSRMWDAIHLAAKALEGPNANQEDRLIILFSDGNDTSSLRTADEAVAAAVAAKAQVYAVAFGRDIDLSNLYLISTLTGGLVLPTEVAADLEAGFARLVDRLGARYTVRWATARRTNAEKFTPGFTLKLSDDSLAYLGDQVFDPTKYEGDPLRGELRFVASQNTLWTTVFLRAEYTPRQVKRIRMYVRPARNFDVSVVSAADEGIAGSWSVTKTPDTEYGGYWLNIMGPTPLPFATFGPLLRLDFDGVVDDATPLFEQIYVDSSIYEPIGQSFRVAGFPNTPPGGS